ncbi:Uncharacterised protein [Pannonibacter phragmitetus]|uniref:Uncharacterized protein n=1 Tax=Pannonibacter phragmitetus TaxID=121719 RepID=A0A378ZWI6_9HYPH|nr:hypothetical protein [Pannonibacter phragmitetus]SUB01584.1 Uncharacterised protein [Pannonibacter phragmitetus]
MSSDLKTIQKCIMGFAKRSEKVSSEILAKTFVDTEPLADVIHTKNSQIVYGRRGTGKTHALLYLAEQVNRGGDYAIYIDLRSIGSDGSIYNDDRLSLAERSSRLIIDVLNAIAGHLFEVAVSAISTALHPQQISLRVDDFEKAISEVRVVGETTALVREAATSQSVSEVHADFSVRDGSLALGGKSSGNFGHESERHMQNVGKQRVSVNFGRVQGTLRSLLSVLSPGTFWVLFDEWSEIPVDLQPYLADLLRRTLMPVENVVVKIGAIEHRSLFYLPGERGEYVGLELGADISADINLDDFLVFESNQHRSLQFFKNLFYRHLQAGGDFADVKSADQLVQLLFTQVNAFEELVRASEGVPRDALNLATKVVTKAFGNKASVVDVRTAARDWYLQDKASPVNSNVVLSSILEFIIDYVIGQRKARAFLVKSGSRDSHIDRLYDARVIHTLKKNISSHDEPGVRYDAFKIDYGCYVELINTQKAPAGLFQTDAFDYIDVPVDDYRSIRRAILNAEDILRIESGLFGNSAC